MRYADAGYPDAIDEARERGIRRFVFEPTG
jgi:hypothetical protein